MRGLRTLFVLVVLSVLPVPGETRADDASVSTNPATGQAESVWVAAAPGGSAEVFYSVLDGTDWSLSERITFNSAPDQNPRLAISGQGERVLTWWRDDLPDTVLVSTKPASGGGWTLPVPLSAPGLDARYPDVVESGGAAFIVFETIPSSGNRQIVVSKQDGPLPWPCAPIATASQSGRLFVQIHAAGGHLWVDWVDSGSSLGWSEFDGASWSAAGNEPYTGAADIEPGRARIRSVIAGS